MKILIDYNGNSYILNEVYNIDEINKCISKYIPIEELIENKIFEKENNIKDLIINVNIQIWNKNEVSLIYKNNKYKFKIHEKEFILISNNQIDIVNIAILDNLMSKEYKFENMRKDILLKKLILDFQMLLKTEMLTESLNKLKEKKINILNNYIEYYIQENNSSDLLDLFEGVYDIDIYK